MGLDDCLGGAGGQDARERPAREDDGAVVRPGRHDHVAGRGGASLGALLDEHGVGAAERDAARAQQQACARALRSLDQRAAAKMVASERAVIRDA
jgi:hypothetical protein